MSFKFYSDKHTGKHYRVCDMTVTQFDGKAFWKGSCLHLWGSVTGEVTFSGKEQLAGWLQMMGFRG